MLGKIKNQCDNFRIRYENGKFNNQYSSAGMI